MIRNLFEMANLRFRQTGLPVVVWIQPSTGNEKHWCRIKVAKQYGDKTTNDLFTIRVDNLKVVGNTGEIKERDVEMVKEFIELNREVLIDYWNDNIDIQTVLERLQKI